MKKWLLIATLCISGLSAFSQELLPDYTIIKFKSRVKEYKKKAPNFEGLDIDKEMISDIVRLLGKSFYSVEEREDMAEKIWLALTNPKKFDLVFKDYAIRTLPNWSKPNFQGKLVLEPNPYLKDWTKADTELDYFKIALHRILMYHKLFGYGEDAKSTQKSVMKMKYVKGVLFRQLYSKDWTNSYLKSITPQLDKKNLVILVTNNGNYEFMICEASKKSELLKLFKRMKWEFVNP